MHTPPSPEHQAPNSVHRPLDTQRLPGIPGQAPHPDALLELDSPRLRGPNAAHLQIQPFPVSFTRASPGSFLQVPACSKPATGSLQT